MRVTALDHVNIVTHQLDATAAFYSQLLGLVRGASPVEAMGGQGAWMHDSSGAAIFHLVAYDETRHGAGGERWGALTGSIDHVALRCTGFAEMLARLAERGLEHRVNDRQFGELRQIFVRDPNNVLLELNFPGD